jgi:integrase
LKKRQQNGNKNGAVKAFKIRPYRDPKRPHLKFVVNSTAVDAMGRKQRVRNFFETRAAAAGFAQKKTVELANGGLEAAQFPSALRVMALQADAMLKPYGKTIIDATRHYLPILQAQKTSCTFATLRDELLTSRERDGASERYLSDLRSRLGQFASAFPDIHVAAIESVQVDDWLRNLDVGPTTRNNFRRVLIVAFNFAVERGYCVGNPAVKSAKAKIVESVAGILTVEQTKKLLEACTGELGNMLPFVAIGAFAGLRRAEIQRLDWREVDFEADLIQVTAAKAKSARRRFVRIRPNLAAWLKPVAQSSGPVTPPEQQFLDAFAEVRKRAGLENWPNNALRHGFASYCLAHENDAAKLALELGHTNTHLVFQHYRELVRPKDAAEYWALSPEPLKPKNRPTVTPADLMPPAPAIN